MVRFLPPILQQHSPPHSPASPKQTLQQQDGRLRITETTAHQVHHLSPPSLVEDDHSQCSSLSSPGAPPFLVSPLASHLRLMVTFPFAVAARNRKDFDKEPQVAEDEVVVVEEEDLNLPHLTMTHDENPFLSCSTCSTSPCGPLEERRRALHEACLQNIHQQRYNLTMKESHDYHHAAAAAAAAATKDSHHAEQSQEHDDGECNKSEVSSISMDSRRRYELMAMNAAAAANGTPESEMRPPVEICFATKIKVPPIPLWLRLDVDDKDVDNDDADATNLSWSSPLRYSQCAAAPAVTSPSRKSGGTGHHHRAHRRSSSAGDAAFASVLVAPSERTNTVVQPSRHMVRPLLRKNQTLPAPQASAISTATTRRRRGSLNHWTSKENVSPTTTTTATSTTSTATSRAQCSRLLQLETWLEKQQQKQQQPDSLLGDRPRRSDAPPQLQVTNSGGVGPALIAIGSIVGQSSVLTPTLSSTSISQKSGCGDDSLLSDQQQQQQERQQQQEQRHRRKPSTLTFLSNMATTPVRRLVQQHILLPDQNKVDLRRAKGCLT